VLRWYGSVVRHTLHTALWTGAWGLGLVSGLGCLATCIGPELATTGQEGDPIRGKRKFEIFKCAYDPDDPDDSDSHDATEGRVRLG
jgi:hypothetical protein